MVEETSKVEAENPFRKGTKKFLVAERLFRGEADNQKIAEEVGVKIDTVYSVKSILRRLGLYQKKRGQAESVSPAFQRLPPAAQLEGLPAKTPQKPSQPATFPESSPELIEEIAREVVRRIRGEGDETPPSALPPDVTPIEVVGEKVHYKVALSPAIFYRYDVFKAEVERRGLRWEGGFSDFLDLAIKDILAVYGIRT